MKISFVIPCYNSENTIENVVNEIMQAVSKTDYEYEILLISDHSPDNVFDVITKMADKNKNISGILLAKNFGQHGAMMAGYHYCSGDIVVSLDDDGQTPACEFNKLVEKLALDDTVDVVYASYENKKHDFFRNFGSKLNDRMAELLIGKPKKLKMSSYFAMRAYIVKELLEYRGAFPYLQGLVIRTTNNIANVPVNHRKRMVGKSGYSFKKLLSLWLNGFTAFSVKPLRIATIIGFVCSLLGFIYLAVIITRKLFNPDVLIGYSSIMAVLLFIGGILMLIMGMIGEYVGRLYLNNNNSPQFVIKTTTNKK